ncbi:MAG: translation elongation factor Ts [Bacteriovoracia bacterium]
MEISAGKVKDLREKTGAGMMDCKKALVECEGDFEKAVEYLRKKGMAAAAKKAGRTAKEGCVGSYIHAGGKIGVLVEVNCETDFVAKNETFQAFVKDVAMHIAASNPRYVKPEDVPADVIAKEKEIFLAQLKQDPKNANKPPQVLEKILEGKVQKFLDEACLVNQGFVRDPEKKISQLTTELIAKIGENISVRRFSRFAVGEGASESTEATE